MPRSAGRARLLFFVCGLLALAESTASGQETAVRGDLVREEPPSPGPDEPVLPLTLQASIFHALASNLALQAQGIEVQIVRTQISAAESVFDPAFSSAFRRIDFETPSPNILETGAIVLDSAIEGERAIFDMGLRQRLQTGASLDLTYSQIRNATSAANRFLNPDVSSSLTLSASQPLLRGGWFPFNQAQIRIAQNNTEIARWQFHEAVNDVLTRVIEAYWVLVFLIEDVEVKRQSVELATEQLEINRVKVQQGVLAPLELKQNETSVYFRTAELINAQKALRDGEDTLRRLILPLEDLDRWEVRLDPVDRPRVEEEYRAPDWKAASKQALDRRPEILQARLDLENRGVVIRAAQTQLLPQLDLSGSYGVNALTGRGQQIQTPNGPIEVPVDGDWKDNLEDLFDPKFRTWTIGLALDVPIGNREAKSALLKAKQERRQALIRYRDLQNSIVQEVREAARGIETAVRTIDYTLKARESAEEQLRAGRSKFDVGLATNFEVLQLQEDLAQKRRDVNRAYTDYAIARARLERATGTLVDYEDLGISAPSGPGEDE
jgi:outer membrane protein